MKSFVLLVGVLLFVGFVDEVQSSHYRGGTISYRPNATWPYSVDFTFRLSFRRGAVYCDSSRVASRSLASTSFSNTWQVTRYYWSYYSSYYSGSANIYCSDFNAQEDWSEGNNSFTFSGSYSDDWWNVRITDGGNWINGMTHSNSYDNMQLEARVKRTVIGVFNNSSPVSSLPLTVYVVQGIPSVIKIPVEDPDGDIVRCRNATYQECYRGMCTYFPYGVLDEGKCTLSYNGGGSVGQLFPIILKLEDYPSGTTQFDSSISSLGSVDLQFVVRVANSSGTNNTCASSPCRNNGACATTYNGYRCYCPYGYTGRQCETYMYPCNSNPCRNGGTCHGSYGGYYCSCPYGYTGQQCQTYLYPCNSNPCRNNGTCNGGYRWYYCSCPYGYTGQQCQTYLYPCNSNPCRNNGTCTNDNLGGYNCSCPYGYTGQQCQSPCPQGWDNFGEFCYKFSSTRLSWENAENTCQSYGGHLASITSQAEQDFVSLRKHISDFWIGYNDRANESSFIWSDGSHPEAYTNWNQGEPNNLVGGNEDCAYLISHSAKWNDEPCGRLRSFICKIKSDTVRIQGGGSSGRLQVLHNGVWGTVCDDGWSMTNTRVVCRQLGFAGALSYHNSGGGSGQIWLDDVRCSGSESAIQQCSHRGWGSHDCNHYEDVFVSCFPSECSNYTVLNTSDRAASYRGITHKCDSYDIAAGWYRFMGDAGTAMPTWCIDSYHCGTTYPGWIQGSHPTQAEGVVNRTVCFSWSNNCCRTNKNIRVRNCGGFYVYDLVRPPYCTLRYCGNGNSTNNTCASSPCRNNGTCATTYNGYRCYCPYGYTGRQCETYMYPCNSNPCRNGGSCYGGYGWYRCSCRYGYTGQQCQSYVNFCASWPCRNGGTCNNNYYSNRYQCSCPYGFTGRQCETSLKTSVTCGENFMQIDLNDQYFPGLDWRTLHLKNATCRATKTAYTMRLRASLDGCGVTYVEHDKKITFWNEVRNELVLWPGWGGNHSAITRGENLVIPFYCEYGREKIVSTNFNPSRKRVYASEGSFGNFTFTMDLYYTSSYRTPYSVFAYPVVVYPNQPLWVQYEVKNTNADLVVFAENCRATTSTNPDSFPQHVFLERGCFRDPTMVYWYNPYSNVQRFSIRSFRFVYSNTFLVYLHCELIVCHRNSTNSRCAQGCISSRKRREADEIDGSNTYELSAGPLKGPNTETGTDQQGGEEASSANTATIASVSALAVVGLLVAILLSVKMLLARRNRLPSKETTPPAIVMDQTLDMNQTVNSYEQHVMEDGETMEIEI